MNIEDLTIIPILISSLSSIIRFASIPIFMFSFVDIIISFTHGLDKMTSGVIKFVIALLMMFISYVPSILTIQDNSLYNSNKDSIVIESEVEDSKEINIESGSSYHIGKISADEINITIENIEIHN